MSSVTFRRATDGMRIRSDVRLPHHAAMRAVPRHVAFCACAHNKFKRRLAHDDAAFGHRRAFVAAWPTRDHRASRCVDMGEAECLKDCAPCVSASAALMASRAPATRGRGATSLAASGFRDRNATPDPRKPRNGRCEDPLSPTISDPGGTAASASLVARGSRRSKVSIVDADHRRAKF